MQRFIDCGKDRTRLLGSITDGNNVGKRLPDKLFDMFRTIMTYIDANFLHGDNRHGIEPGWICPGACNLETVSRHAAEKRFCHLATR